MKKTVSLLLSFIFFFPLPNYGEVIKPEHPPRGLFISVIQDPPVLTSRHHIATLIDFAERAGVKTFFVQIYRANQAWFPSKVGDSAPFEKAFKEIGEDPLKLMIKEAHASGIQVHAWLNLLSLSTNENAPLLKKYGTDILTRDVNPKSQLEDYKIDSQYFLDAGDLRVREELKMLTEEIVTQYPELDGIQFDYIRYPDVNTDVGYAPMNVERFRKYTGAETINRFSKDWHNWKRAQVTGLLTELVASVKKLHPTMQISTTGCMNYQRAYEWVYQEWMNWIKSDLIDFVTMMSYPANLQEFEKNVTEAKTKTGDDFRKVNIGIGAYKLLKSPEIFAEQFELCEKSQGRSCVVFHYGDIVQSPALGLPMVGKNISVNRKQ